MSGCRPLSAQETYARIREGTSPWVFDEARVLPEPWFLLSSWCLRMHQLADAPAAFKRRNVYGGERILSRA